MTEENKEKIPPMSDESIKYAMKHNVEAREFETRFQGNLVREGFIDNPVAKSNINVDKKSCIAAGMSLIRDLESYNLTTPVVFRDNLKGVVKDTDFKVPSSELALHTKTADKDIIAFAMVGRGGALVAYENDGGCGYIWGTDTELLSPSLRGAADNMFEKRGPGGTIGHGGK